MSERDEIQVEAYSGYKQGETPRKVFLNGREFPVEYIVFRNRELDVDTNQFTEHFRLKLKDYGECDIVYKEQIESWEMKEPPQQARPFSEQILDSSDDNKGA